MADPVQQARARRPDGICTTCGGALGGGAIEFTTGGGCCVECTSWYRAPHQGQEPQYRNPRHVEAIERLARLLSGHASP